MTNAATVELSAPVKEAQPLAARPPLPTGKAAPSSRQTPAFRQALLAILALFFLLWNFEHLIILFGRMPDNDFGKGYFSTLAFLQGGEMYGYNESIPALFEEGHPINLWNLNPPHFHVILLPLAYSPPLFALFVWTLLNLGCLYVGLRWIAAELGLNTEQRTYGLIWFLSFTGTNAAFISGHCSFLLFLLVTAMWLAARRGQWGKAGLYLGLSLSVKPFLLILVPYLLLTHRWKALGTASAMVLACFAVGLAVFGVNNHLEWVSKFHETGNWSWQFINGSIYGMFSRTLLDNPMATPLIEGSQLLVTVLWLALGVPMGLVTLAVSRNDRSQRGIDRALGILLVAAMMLSPLGWTYYYCLPLGPVAMLALGWWRRLELGSVWSRRLLAAGLIAFAWPLLSAGLLQPYVLSTLLIGNLYCYGTVAVWLALVVDAVRQHRAARADPCDTARLSLTAS